MSQNYKTLGAFNNINDILRNVGTEEIICPHCYHEFQGSWEFKGDSGKIECYECEKEFFYERQIDIRYTTVKMKESKI